MKVKQTLLLTGVLLLELMGAGSLSAQQLYYNGSVQFATGSYFFEETTQSFYFTNGLAVSHPRYNVSLSYPLVIQSTPWISYGGTGALPTGGPQHNSVGEHFGPGTGQGMGGMGGRGRHIILPDTASYTHSGFSDPTLSTGYRLYGSQAGSTVVQVNSTVKFPLADPTRGFGTGAWDVGIGGSLLQRIGTWFVMSNTMYWHFGDLSDLELKNAWSYGAGIGKALSGGRWTILGSFTGMTEVIEGIDPPLSAGAGIGHQIGERTYMNLTLTFGLSESSSDVAFGGGWQVKLN